MTDGPGMPAFEEPDFSGFPDDEAGDEIEDETDDGFENEAAARSSEPDEADGNSVRGGRAVSVLDYVAKAIAEDKAAVVVEAVPSRGQLRLQLHVAPGDMGRVIGRRGRTAQALRTLVRAAASSEGQDTFVDIVD